MAAKDMLALAQTLQATALAGSSYGLVRKKKKKVSDFIGVATTNMIGSSMIKAQADITGGM